MENKDISQIALQKIKESGIKPISKKVFSLKRIIFWVFVCFFVVIGALSYSVILSILFNNDWYLYNKLGFIFTLKTLPYFWFICLLLFTVLGEIYYRKTLLGYRHRIITIIGIYIIITGILGTILHFVEVGEMIENSISSNIPAYSVVVFDRDEIWSHPEQGLLTGQIVEINDDVIKVSDSNGIIWDINVNDTSIDKKVKLEVGEYIKIVGDMDDDIDNLFNANEIHLP